MPNFNHLRRSNPGIVLDYEFESDMDSSSDSDMDNENDSYYDIDDSEIYVDSFSDSY